MGELGRKILHISGAAIPFVAPRLGLPVVIGGAAALAVLYVAHEIHGLRHLDPVKRKDGFDPAPLEYGFSVVAMLLLPGRAAGYAAIEVLALGDGLASLAGGRIGISLPGTEKTLEGSIACFLAGLAGSLLFLDPASALLAAAVGAAVEAYVPFDNLSVPFAVYLVLMLPLP